MMRIFRTVAIVALTLLTLSSCRSVRPEAGLPASAFEGVFPRVVSNDRGFWFLVTDGKGEAQPFVALGEGAQREVFYAIQKGSRTFRLMPLTPFAYNSLDIVRETRVEAQFLANPAEAGAELPDSIGWMSKADSTPTWAGATPVDNAAVMLVDGSVEDVPTLSSWFLGTAVVKDGKLVSVQYDAQPNGPVIALLDGERPTRPIRAALAGLEIKPTEGVEFSSLQVNVPDSSTFVTRPAALRAGVDALVMAADGGNAQITLTRSILRNGLPLSLTNEPFTIGRAEVESGLLALRDIANGRDLAAVKRMLALEVGSNDNLIAGRMRVLELLAAAGYVDWTRNAMIANAQGLSADAALYLARSHYVAGDFHRARDFAERAAERFGGWPEPARSHGFARARLISARLAARDGDWETAFALALEASEAFVKAGDEMRAADAELLAAHFALNGEDLTRAVQAGALARSRFFHGSSPYHAAFAELALADIYARAGEAAEAQKMTEYAKLRFDELADPVGRNRARIANGRALSVTSPAQGVRDLEIGLETAQTAGDFVGVVDAAASLVVLGSAPKDATASYGLVIAAGLARTEDPYVRERAAQALTLLCSRGMAASVDQITGASPRDIAVAKAACASGPATEQSDNMVGSLIAQGWAAWRAGNVEEAATVATRLEQSIDDELRQNAPRQAGEALFFAAVVARESDQMRSNELALQGVRLLGDHIDPTRLASVLDEMALQYVSRGQVWLAGDLLRAAAVNAQDQGQAELRRDLVMRRVEVLHQGGDYDGALAAIYDAQPALETAGAASAPALARLYVLQQDALLRLGRNADAAVAQKKVTEVFASLEPVPQVELVLLQGQLAASRGDEASAKAALTRAERLEAALAEGLATDEQRKLLRSRIKLARADAALNSGASGEAANLYVEALDGVADLASNAAVVAFRVAALRGLGESTTNPERLASTIAELEAARGVAVKEFPSIAPAATAALVALEIAAGRPSRAIEVVEAAKLDGVAVAQNPLEAQCLEARAGGLSSTPGAVALLNRCASRSSGDEAADAALLAVLVDPKATAAEKNRKAREIAADPKQLSKRTVERLTYVSELAAGTKPDDKREERLNAALAKAKERGQAKQVVKAVEDLTEYLVDTGQAPRAVTLIDQNSSAFYDLGDGGPGALARLRAEARVGTLDAVAGYAFAERAIAETPDLDPSDEAGLLFVNARHAVVLGMWQAAQTNLAAAREAAARDAGLRRRIDAFGRRFGLR